MPTLQENLFDAILSQNKNRVAALLKHKDRDELHRALALPDKRGWTPLEYLLHMAVVFSHDDYTIMLQPLLEVLENEILYNPAHLLIKQARQSMQDSFARLKNSHLVYDTHFKTLQIFFDYIFTVDQNKKEEQRVFTNAEINTSTEILIKLAKKNPQTLEDLGNHYFMQFDKRKVLDDRGVLGTFFDKKGNAHLDENAKNMLAISGVFFAVAHDPQRFDVYRRLMELPNPIELKLPESISDLIKRDKINTETFDKLMRSPLVAGLEKQANSDVLAAIELGELYLNAWHFSVRQNAAPDVIANNLNRAITYLNQALYINDKEFPSRALELLTEIRNKLKAIQEKAAEAKQQQTDATIPVKAKEEEKRQKESTSLEEDDEAVITRSSTPVQIETKISVQPPVQERSSEQWLAFLSLLTEINNAERQLQQPFTVEEAKGEIEKRRDKAERERLAAQDARTEAENAILNAQIQGDITEQEANQRLANLPEVKAVPEEKALTEAQAIEVLQGQSAIQILVNAITDEKTEHVDKQMLFRYLEKLALDPKIYSSFAVDHIVDSVKQKFGTRQDPDYHPGEGPRLPPAPDQTLPQLSALQAVQLVRNIPSVQSKISWEDFNSLLSHYLNKYLEQQSQEIHLAEPDLRQPRVTSYALSQLLKAEEHLESKEPYPLTLKILRLKLQEPDRIAETLPDVPDSWLAECFEQHKLTQHLSNREKFNILKYYVTQQKNFHTLYKDYLYTLLKDCRNEPNFRDILLAYVKNSATWGEDYNYRVPCDVFLSPNSTLRNFFDVNPIETIRAFLPALGRMASGVRSEQSYFIAFVLDKLRQDSLSYQGIFSIISPEQVEKLVSATLDLFRVHGEVSVGNSVSLKVCDNFIIAAIEQKKVSADFTVQLLKKLGELTPYENKYEKISRPELTQNIFLVCVRRYGELSPESRKFLQQWVTPEPRRYDPNRCIYTDTKISNLIQFWVVATAHGEDLSHEISNFINKIGEADKESLKQMQQALYLQNKDETAFLSAFNKVGNLLQGKPTVVESKYPSSAALRSSVAAERPPSPKRNASISPQTVPPVESKYSSSAAVRSSAAAERLPSPDRRASETETKDVNYQQFFMKNGNNNQARMKTLVLLKGNVDNLPNIEDRLQLLDKVKILPVFNQEKNGIKKLYIEALQNIDTKRSSIIGNKYLDNRTRASELLTNTLQRARAKLAVAELATGLGLITSSYDIKQLTPKVQVLQQLQNIFPKDNSNMEKFLEQLQQAVEKFKGIVLGDITSDQLQECKDFLAPPQPAQARESLSRSPPG